MSKNHKKIIKHTIFDITGTKFNISVKEPYKSPKKYYHFNCIIYI